MSTERPIKRTILILGGGVSGQRCAASLRSELMRNAARLEKCQYSIVLIDNKDHHLHLLASHRAVVAPANFKWPERVCIPRTNLFSGGQPANTLKKGTPIVKSTNSIASGGNELQDARARASKIVARVVWGNIISVDHVQKLVTYADQDLQTTTLEYNYLVLATGSKWSGLFDFAPRREDAIQQMRSYQEQIAKAKVIAIVGGGLVGCELASEIKSFYPDIKVTIVHKNDHLLQPIYPVKLRERLYQKMTDMGIEVLLNHRVDDLETFLTQIKGKGKTDVSTHKGLILQDVDWLIGCLGDWERNTGYLDPAILTPKTKCVMIKDTFQVDVPGWENVFGIGDIAQVEGEVKQADKYPKHGEICAKNVVNLELKKKLHHYGKQQNKNVCISLGPDRGLLRPCAGIILGDFVSRLAKSRTLLIHRPQKGMNMKEEQYLHGAVKAGV